MRVRLGWTGEIDNTWHKADVELEEDDLHRLVVESDLPGDVRAAMSTKVCFQLLKNEAEFLLLGKLTDLGYPEEKANGRRAVLNGQNKAILGALRQMAAA